MLGARALAHDSTHVLCAATHKHKHTRRACASSSPDLLYTQVEEGSASGAAALHLAAYLFYSHSFERARSLLEKQTGPHSAAAPAEALRAQALLGFVLLEQQAQEEAELQDPSELHQALQLFDTVLQHDPQDLEVTMWLSQLAPHQPLDVGSRSSCTAAPLACAGWAAAAA